MSNTEEKMHVFEKAGLGLAPFKCIAVESRIGPLKSFDDKTGITTEVGSPGQPMGCCKFCYTGIATCYVIKSADGNVFDVGCECVRKANDSGLKKAVNQQATKVRHAREAVKIEELKALLADEKVREILSGIERTRGTVLDYCEWMMENAGNAGKLKILKKIKEEVSLATRPTKL